VGNPTPSPSNGGSEAQDRLSYQSGGGNVPANEPGRPFDWMLGGGVVLLAAAFVARAYLGRRFPA
jgi:hypothetical protein